MLLNEFLKEHKKVEAQQATIARVKVNRRSAAKGNGGSHGPAERAGSANPKSKRATRTWVSQRRKWFLRIHKKLVQR